jgi:hypothetical protein
MRKPELTARFSSPRVICSVSTSILCRRLPGPSCYSCLFGDVGHDHNFGSVGKSQPLGTVRVIRRAHLNHERAEEKASTQSHDERQPAPQPEQVPARQCKDDPCHHPPEWRAPGVNASRNSSGKGQRSPEQGLPPTQRCRESRSRVGLRSHHGSRGNSPALGCSVERSSTRFARNN